ncbi:MAG: hypothetical protein JWM11_3309 [Planctomycetaceae bacterium]|nr:hypothetical protein [Planctomycetaceae bacterium]
MGHGSCADGVGLDLDVQLIDTAAGCLTIVSSSLLSYDLIYEGTLPPISFTVENEAGDLLDVTLGVSAVVENPIAKVADSPCSCANCLPAVLCIELHIGVHFVRHPPAIIPDHRVGIAAPFNCDGWTVPDQTITPEGFPYESQSFSMSITLLPVSSGLCGIHVTASLSLPDGAGAATIDENIIFEIAQNPEDIDGTICETNEGVAWVLSESGGGGSHRQGFISLIDETFVLSGYEAGNVGSVRIRDLSCGSCEVCNPVPPPPGPCCATQPLSLTLSCSAGSTVFLRPSSDDSPPFVWSQQMGSPCWPYQTTPYAIVCDGEKWFLGFVPGGNVPLTGSCDPVVYFTFSLDGEDFVVTE